MGILKKYLAVCLHNNLAKEKLGEQEDYTQNKFINVNNYLIQTSQAVKKVCSPQQSYGEKRYEIQGGGQEMAVMVG